VYIDECQDYLSTDSNFTLILEQARKQNVGVIVHQYLSQLGQKTLDSLYANTSIKFAGGISDKDAYALARNMRCEPSFIAEQPKGSFAAYVRNTTKNAISLKFPLFQLGPENRMRAERYAKVLDAMRAKYAVHYTKLLAPPPARIATPPPGPDSKREMPQPDTTATRPEPPPPKPGASAKTKKRQWPM
jgi:hypothetical protein